MGRAAVHKDYNESLQGNHISVSVPTTRMPFLNAKYADFGLADLEVQTSNDGSTHLQVTCR